MNRGNKAVGSWPSSMQDVLVIVACQRGRSLGLVVSMRAMA